MNCLHKRRSRCMSSSSDKPTQLKKQRLKFAWIKMASLLKKVWSSVISRSGISSSSSVGSTTRDFYCDSGSLGALDQIPIDIIMQILLLLEPRDTARLALVCRYLRVLVSDNRLWMSFLQNGKDSWDWVVFSETHLNLGPPLK